MGDDPLSLFTRKHSRDGIRPSPSALAPNPTLPPGLVPHATGGREEYQAFGTSDRVEGIALHRGKGVLSYTVMQPYIHNLAYDEDAWTMVALTVSGMHIEIRGRNLRAIAEAISRRACAFVQEFRPDRFVLAEPVKADMPFVERIAVHIVSPAAPPEPG